MSEYDLDSILDDEDDSTSGDLPKVLRKKIKDLQKQYGELLEETTTLRGAERKRALSSALEGKGLNPKISAFVPQDLNAEQIDEWLTEYGDVFGQPAASTSSEPVIARNAEEAAAIRQMALAEQGGSPASAQDLLSQINGAESMDDIMRALGR